MVKTWGLEGRSHELRVKIFRIWKISISVKINSYFADTPFWSCSQEDEPHIPNLAPMIIPDHVERRATHLQVDCFQRSKMNSYTPEGGLLIPRASNDVFEGLS